MTSATELQPVRKWYKFDRRMPVAVTVGAAAVMLFYGPLHQFESFNQLADHSVLGGIHHAGDVISSGGYAIVGLFGILTLLPNRLHPSIRSGWAGYSLFLFSLILTALGSAYYHLSPSDGRLVWDRLPIALCCAGLLAAVRAESRRLPTSVPATVVLAGCAIASVIWWRVSEFAGDGGDLRPYLLLETLPLALIPLWQAIYDVPYADRVWFGSALGLYIVGKSAQALDFHIQARVGWISGHTIWHLLAAAAAGVIAVRLNLRLQEEPVRRRGCAVVSSRK